MTIPPIARTNRRVSVSTWALHPLLGTVSPGRPGAPDERMMTPQPGADGFTLLEVPAALAARNIRTMELCHFHIPSRETPYLESLRAALEASGVELWCLLIDDGDLTDLQNGDQNRQWVEEWIDTASYLGARCVRVIAGKQPTTQENMRYAERQLKALVMHAYLRGIHVLTENWFPLLSTPDAVNELLDALNAAVGLKLDFGNWDSHADKYADLAAIAPRAVSCHAKCHFANGVPDADEYRRCLDITREADYSGPFTLVHGEPGNVWESIDAQAAIIKPYL